MKANPGKKLIRKVNGRRYARYPIKTKIVTPKDDMFEVVVDNTKDVVQPDDIICFSEKATAISQGRAYPKEEIKPGWLARTLVKYVTKSDRGIGISSPETFQLAVEECGSARIILGAIAGGIGKLIGVKGLFYHVCGNKARLIDGAAEYVIPPYNTYISKGPARPDDLSNRIKAEVGAKTAVIDINDYGGIVVGSSNDMSKQDEKILLKILADNPLGQSKECTPVAIIREIKS